VRPRRRFFDLGEREGGIDAGGGIKLRLCGWSGALISASSSSSSLATASPVAAALAAASPAPVAAASAPAAAAPAPAAAASASLYRNSLLDLKGKIKEKRVPRNPGECSLTDLNGFEKRGSLSL